MTSKEDRKPTRQQKQEVFDRAGGCCEYRFSRADFSPSPFAVEHIVPRQQSGSMQTDNLAFSCQGCNNHKYTSTEVLDPGSGLLVPLYHPRRDDWNEHFSWSDDFLTIIGKTPTGRATVSRLYLNRASVVNLRRVLKRDGKHPPKLRLQESN